MLKPYKCILLMVVLSSSTLCVADYNVGVAAAADRGAEL